jgi:signal transduction histidine kinase/HAMP domain-containing protein
MGTRLRRLFAVNFATRLLIGGLVITLGLIGSVSAALLISRAQETNGAALSNADGRAKLLRSLLQHVTAPQALAAAKNLACAGSVINALSPSSPSSAGGIKNSIVNVPDETPFVFDATGKLIYPATTGTAPATGALESVRIARSGQNSQGVEVLNDGTVAYDFAVPVYSGCPHSSPLVLGVAMYSVPLTNQLGNYTNAVGYPTVMMLTGGATTTKLTHVTTGKNSSAAPTVQSVAAPTLLSGQIAKSPDIADAIYAAGSGDVATSLAAMGSPQAAVDTKHSHIAAYVGVETPLSDYVIPQQADERSVLLLAMTAALVVMLAVILFVNRFVRKPVAKLGEGVARIAGGDYTADIPVVSHDELGLLAERVNSMRAQIASYIRHVDGSVARLGEVSHALTTTTAGVTALARAVCSAAEAIAGEGTKAFLFQRNGEALAARAGDDASMFVDEYTMNTVLETQEPLKAEDESGIVVTLPMLYQGDVTGALVVRSASDLTDTDVSALGALCNNAAIALENTRLFEQERATVRKLLELDAAKSDFLSTAQHELRTPVLAIMGQLELVKAAWQEWDEDLKLGVLTDIEISTRLLGELLESIIDFSLLSTDALHLRWETIDVEDTVIGAVDAVSGHFREGIPIPVNVDVESNLTAVGDSGRFRQVVRLLLDNAVKFSPDGAVTIKATRDTDTEAGCRIEIIDTGIGIDPQALPRIFERFYQVDNTQTRAYGGLGMGLALVDALCKAHGAEVMVESEVGKGTHVTVVWPTTPPEGIALVQTPKDGFHMSKL